MPPTVANRAASLNLPDEELRELAGLTYCDGPLIGNLEQCPALLRMFAQAMDLPWLRGKENHPVVGQGLAAELGRFLAWLVQTGRDNVLGSAAGQNKELSHAAAVMGELLRLSNKDDFKARLEKTRCMQAYADAAARKEHNHDRGERQLRAAMWLNPPKQSARTMARKEKDDRYPYIVFRQILRDQLRNSRGIEARGELEAKLSQEVVDSLKLETVSPPAEPQSSSRDGLSLPLQSIYVHRPELEAQFRALIDSAAKPIVFVGQAGMGKTWLAEELTRDPATGKPAPIIDASMRETLSRDLMAAYSSLGIQLPSVADPVVQLANLACCEMAPPFIILDNLDGADELKELLPRHTNSTIVATCRSAGGFPAAYESIYVDRMQRPEAIEMISHRLPNLSIEEMNHLASAFGGYPLVIGHVCGIYPDQTTSMAELCNQLKADALKLASQIETEDRAILHTILKRLVGLVKQRDPSLLAYEILAQISFIAPRVSCALLARYMKTTHNEGKQIDASIAYAIGLLRSLSLIQPESTASSRHEYIVIHPFTQNVLRQEFGEQAVDAFDRVFWVLDQEKQLSQAFKGDADDLSEIDLDALVDAGASFINLIKYLYPASDGETSGAVWEILRVLGVDLDHRQAGKRAIGRRKDEALSSNWRKR